MSAERHIISGLYGICKITVDGSDFFFDIITSNLIPNEIQDRDENLFGTTKNKVVGYKPEFNMLLGTLIPNTDVIPNITKTGKNIYDFLNAYHSYDDEEKLFTIVPAYGTGIDFNELNNRNSFKVLMADGKPPLAIPYKESNVPLGQALSISAISKYRIGYADFQYFYRNTLDGTWINVGGLDTAEVRISTGVEDLEIRISTGVVDAEFLIDN